MIASPWEILGIPATNDREAIRRAYIRQARRHHPDHYGMNPAQYRVQEERMREINLAYQSALAEIGAWPDPAPAADEPPSASASPERCVEHGQPGAGYCRSCRAPLCGMCVGRALNLCNRHLADQFYTHCARRAGREWLPFLALVLGAKLAAIGPGWSLAVLLTYVFGLGLIRVGRLGWRGLLYLWIFPFGAIAGGLYSLYECLDYLHRAPRDEALWKRYVQHSRDFP